MWGSKNMKTHFHYEMTNDFPLRTKTQYIDETI